MYDGTFVTSSRLPRLVAQTTMVPLRPYITRLSSRISIDLQRGTITIGRGPREIVMHLGSLHADGGGGPVELGAAPFEADDTIYVPLAAIARELGETVVYAPAMHAVLVEFADPLPLATMTPFNALEPQATRTQLFTAEPKRVERAIVSGTPRPRRTPIPATPSRP